MVQIGFAVNRNESVCIMGIVEYDYTKFTDKDMFKIRLAGTIPDFGYISCKKRKPFYEFCKKHGFISLYSLTTNGKIGVYHVHTTFRFSALFDYSSRPVIAASGISMIIVGKDHRMSNTGVQHK